MSPEELLQQAKAGSGECLGQLLEAYRHYLRLLSRMEIGQRLQGKADASDLVQETFLEAHRHFPQFQGNGEREFIAWLRRILAGNLANLLRRYLGTQGRDIRLEQDLVGHLANSSRAIDLSLVAAISSPSQQASRREQAVLLADALARLSPDYREVIILRHLEGCTFPEVARRMERSLDSVEKLWLRALAKLKASMRDDS